MISFRNAGHRLVFPLVAGVFLLLPALIHAAQLFAQSANEQTSLVELYSSEGCSSCPPADAWISTLKESPDLWRKFVPVVFHVDYWNGLGWKDSFSRAEFTRRQNDYAAQWGANQVYTPEFVVNGREWTAWRHADKVPTGRASAGMLKVYKNGTRYEVEYTPTDADGPFIICAALLGNNIRSKVGAGENAGKELQHNFVVLSFERQSMKAKDGYFSGSVRVPSWDKTQAPSAAMAFWITGSDGLTAVQAAGNDLR